MAQFSVKYGLLANKPAYSAAIEGTLLFTTDSHELFANVNGAQFKVGAFDSVANTDALASADTSKMYYVRDIKALAVYNASKSQWEQVNADTGATAVTVVGTGTAGAVAEGDVITAASYSASTRTITLTASRVTAANVDRGSNSNVDADLTAVENAINTINGDASTNGSVSKKISDAIGALDTTNDVTIASVSSDVVTIKAGVKEVDGVIAQGTGSDITLAKVAKTGAATDVEYKAETSQGAGDSESVGAALARLDGNASTSGSVAKAVKDAVEGLDVNEFALASVNNNVVNIKGIKEVDGKVAVGDGAGINLEEVAYTGAAADVSVADAGNNFTGANVEAVLAEIASAISSTGTAGVVSVETPTSSSYASVYEFYQGLTGTETAEQKAAKKIGTINIPKDMVISAGEVKTVTTADTPYTGAVVGDKYIDLTIANNDGTHIYIPVKDLVDVYTGSVGAEVTVTVSGANVIGATINKIGAAKIITREAQAAQGNPDDPDYVPAVAEQTLAQKLVEMEQAQTAAIQALDADLDASGTAQHSGTFVVSGVTQVDGKITAVDSVEVEAAGAAAAVQTSITGESTDTASDLTLNGLSKKAAAAQNDVDALETLVGTIPGTSDATTVIGYVDEKVTNGLSWGTF